MTRKLVVIMALAACALAVTGCKKEEKAKEGAAATTQQAAAPSSSPGLVNYDFESGLAGWQQRVKGVSIDTSNSQKHGGNASLKISGLAVNGSWNFAGSPQFNLEPGKQYKFTVWMLVDDWDNFAAPPFIKCGISKNGKWAANEPSSKYILKKMKQWQMVTGNFTAPADGSITGSFSLEKGTQNPIKGTVYLDDIKLELAQ